MNRFTSLLAASLFASTLCAVGENAPTVVASPIGDFTIYAGATRSVDVATAFPDPGVTDAIRMTTVLGNIDLELFGEEKPITVTNFLKYVDQGRYFLLDPTANQTASGFIHRSAPGFVIQGGGYIGTVAASPTPGSANND